MRSVEPEGQGVLGTLGLADGLGLVRLEVRLVYSIAEVWSAITDPSRLALWHARVEGDLRPGGEFRILVEADDWEGTGRVVACEPESLLLVTRRESDDSWRRGRGAPPFDAHTEVRLVPDGSATILNLEVRGLPPGPLAAFGAGWQIHVENLAAYLAGDDRGDTEARWMELIPAYEAQAAGLR
jgi:uncharacterized protein YndB with AHSA1/START domain